MTPQAIFRELDLEQLFLKAGGHQPDGEFCVMEAVAYVAGESWSDHPRCASTVISAIMRRLNDSMSDEQRQLLKPYIPRLVGTAGSTETEERRRWMAADWSARVAAPRAFRRIGLIWEASKLESLAEIVDLTTYRAAVPVINRAADAAYKFRSERRAELEAKLRNLLVGKGFSEAEAAVAAAVEAVAAAVEAEAVEAEAVVAEAVEAAVVAEAEAADPALLEQLAAKLKGKTSFSQVYPIVREEFRPLMDAALKDFTADIITSALGLVDRLIAVGSEVAA